MRQTLFCTIILLITLGSHTLLPGQTRPPSQPVPLSTTPDAQKRDTIREFEIIKGPSLRMIQTDTGMLQTIAGGAVVKHEGTKFYADSIVMNNDTRRMESFGHVHINDGDTVNIYSSYLRYNAAEKYAFLKNNVKLTGRNGTLFTEELDYDLNSGIGNYYKGGRIINKKNIITSVNGTYYADTRDVYFKKNVKMDGPKDHIRADSLIYNMNDGNITFVSDTYVKNDEMEIRTTEGRYDTNTGDGFFSARTNVRDSSGRIYTANSMAIEGKSGNAQLEGNAIIIDSTNGFSLLANQIFLNQNENSFFATRKPVLIIRQKDDSIYVASDIIYSGLAKNVKGQLVYPTDSATIQSQQQSDKISSFKNDREEMNMLEHIFNPDDSSTVHPASDAAMIDSLPQVSAVPDSTVHANADTSAPVMKPATPTPLKPVVKAGKRQRAPASDSANVVPRPDTTGSPKPPTDTSMVHMPRAATDTAPRTTLPDFVKRRMPASKDSIAPDSTIAHDSLATSVSDTLMDRVEVQDSTAKSPDSTRYFIAYHHVRIYNDSLQSVCDSLFISSADSVFRLYHEPVLWSGRTQVSGDTMFLFTKNKEPERLFVFDRALVVSRTTEGFFNQISGKTLNAYFKNSKFDYIRIKGSQSESIYFLQDDDSAYIGMNRASGDVIDMLFKNGELQKVLFINQVPGMMYPMGAIPEDKRFLKGFEWLDNRRPKNRAELFQ